MSDERPSPPRPRIGRRAAISTILGAMVSTAIPFRAVARSSARTTTMPVAYPPFELQADRDALAAVANGITGIKLEGAGGRIDAVWLRDSGNQPWLVSVDQRDLRFKFEVFALGIMSIDELRARWRDWKKPPIPADMPEPFRSFMATRPPEPVPPQAFDRWPLTTNRVEVLRRAEFIIEDVDVGSTFGDNPNTQSAASPGKVPREASASCEVAAGLLFTGTGNERLLIAADWMPMALLTTQDAGKIDEFTADCQRVELRAYAESLGRA